MGFITGVLVFLATPSEIYVRRSIPVNISTAAVREYAIKPKRLKMWEPNTKKSKRRR